MPRTLGYHMILVPICQNTESEQAMDVACRLAADHGATVVAVAVVEVPPLLPIDAHMRDEEALAHRLLERAGAIADRYGVGLVARTLRGREPAGAIVAEAGARAADLLVIGAPRKPRLNKRGAVFGATVEHVLKKAPCRVMVIGAAQATSSAARSAAA